MLQDGERQLGAAARENRRFGAADGLCGMGFAGAAALRSGALQAPKAFDIVGHHREMNLEFGLGEPDPSHGTKMIAALPGAEDFLNPRAADDYAPRALWPGASDGLCASVSRPRLRSPFRPPEHRRRGRHKPRPAHPG